MNGDDALWPAVYNGTVSLANTVGIGKARGVPILVDAAGQAYPVQ